MKKLYFALLALLCFCLARPSLAQTEFPTIPPALEEIQLEEVTSKIRKKEDFYLFVGRPDNVEAQKALETLSFQAPHASRPVYFLNIKGVNSRQYKAFSKKYKIRSHAYLARFANRQQVAVFHNNWWTENPDVLAFLLIP